MIRTEISGSKNRIIMEKNIKIRYMYIFRKTTFMYHFLLCLNGYYLYVIYNLKFVWIAKNDNWVLSHTTNEILEYIYPT